MSYRTALCGLFAAFNFTAFALESNSVATNQLTATMTAVANAGVTVLNVDLVKVSAENGSLKEESATLSADETVTFSVNGQSVQFDPKDAGHNVLPLVEQGDYSMEFKRANGEIYTSTVKLPPTPAFLTPAMSSRFPKTDEVVAQWTPIQAMGAMLIMGANCSPIAGDVNEAFTAVTFPADWTKKCAGPVSVQLNTLAFNAGSGFGAFVGIAASALEFHYEGTGAPAPRKARNKGKSAADLGRMLLKARKDGVKVIRLN
jgi:hypothetical protein